MFFTLLSSNVTLLHWGYLIIRIGVGALFVIHGFSKVMGGPSSWIWLGNQMAHLGITFLPIVWGALAAFTELVCGAMLIFGLSTRLAAFLIGCVMVVALVMHLNTGDPYSKYSYPLMVLIIMAGIFIAGSGDYYSVDKKLLEKMSNQG
jgi:putative oxidoreductase